MRFPSRSGRGVGLLEAILSVAVVSVFLLWSHAAIRDWLETAVVRNEARTVADVARAGRLFMEREDRGHARWTHGAGAAPLEIPMSELEDADLISSTVSVLSPERRSLSLHLWVPTAGEIVIIARARGANPFPRIPGAGDGVSSVGVLVNDTAGVLDTNIRGPGVNFDMAAVNTALPGFAGVNDIFAFEHVSFDVLCGVYLHRVDGCPNNDMQTSLNMGGNDLLNVGNIQANQMIVDRFVGDMTVQGGIELEGGLEVGGVMDVQTLNVNSGLVAGSLDVTGDMNVSRDLTVSGAVTASEATIIGGDDPGGGPDRLPGRVVAFGEAVFETARADKLNIERVNVGEICDPAVTSGPTVCTDGIVKQMTVQGMGVTRLDVDQISASRATFTEIFADDVTVSTCSGCTP